MVSGLLGRPENNIVFRHGRTGKIENKVILYTIGEIGNKVVFRV